MYLETNKCLYLCLNCLVLEHHYSLCRLASGHQRNLPTDLRVIYGSFTENFGRFSQFVYAHIHCPVHNTWFLPSYKPPQTNCPNFVIKRQINAFVQCFLVTRSNMLLTTACQPGDDPFSGGDDTGSEINNGKERTSVSV